MDLTCRECHMTFNTEEEFANHRTKFCINSDYYDPEILQNTLTKQSKNTSNKEVKTKSKEKKTTRKMKKSNTKETAKKASLGIRSRKQRIII